MGGLLERGGCSTAAGRELEARQPRDSSFHPAALPIKEAEERKMSEEREPGRLPIHRGMDAYATSLIETCY